ncbi:hypothetical protein MNV49_002546 [Pseudohyphozyma bogoriensis]|nr:hypothetical protein MNV49_002546 [Pseudohyphozyma bogoriensis]
MAASFEPIQQAAAATMLRDVLADPDEFQNHAKKYAASVVMSINYGKTTPTAYTDTDVVEVNECGSRLGAALRPGHYAVDTYHFLSYLPGKWKKEGKEWHDIELALFKRQLQTVRDAMRFGGGADCFGRYIIEHQNEYKLSDDEAAYLAGSIFGAGSDTTASTISIAIMAAVLYPSAVASAQQELDTVVGRDRYRSDLPYIEAFRKEVFRWRPVSSGGFRHATTQDLEYQGYTIPAGTAIVGNHWSISRDPAVFSRPEEFRPERWFVDEDAARAELRKDIDHVGYGFGRRACAGKNVADRSTFITISNLLWAFNFTKKRDQAGREIEIDSLAFTDVANSHPLPFAASITPRDEHVVKVVEDESL